MHSDEHMVLESKVHSAPESHKLDEICDEDRGLLPMQGAKDALMLFKIRKYLWKKHLRGAQKKVRYNCRQDLAKQRFRH